MEKYANKGGSSGVAAYQIGTDYIWVQFTSGSIYEYTYASAGSGNIESMKSLAKSGSGLNTFITKNVRTKFSRKIS
ncbi:hypothetical protein [Pedobacter sp. N23S346]|uniref:hypothetical protein n=1 Tax=Pedobacter sp. N23S346 TaxID=3402750 RepID=UPI003ABDFBEB